MKFDSNENLPLVTVITPSYNHAAFIRETIDSVRSQDYPHIEYVVLNDGSTDETHEILCEYGDRFVWETQEEMFQTATINKGWAMTKGEIVTWLNSDDTFYDSSAVGKAVEHLLANPETGIVFGDTMFTQADGTEIERSRPILNFNYFDFVLNCINQIPQPSSFIRRDVIKKVGNLDSKYNYFMDWDFWLRAGLYFKIDYFPELLSTYRLHPASKTVSQAKKAAPELEFMYKNFFARDDVSEELRAVEKQAMMNMCFTSGGYYLRGGDEINAAKMASKAFKYNPPGKFKPPNLHKYMYCKYGNTLFYRKSRELYHSIPVKFAENS